MSAGPPRHVDTLQYGVPLSWQSSRRREEGAHGASPYRTPALSDRGDRSSDRVSSEHHPLCPVARQPPHRLSRTGVALPRRDCVPTRVIEWHNAYSKQRRVAELPFLDPHPGHGPWRPTPSRYSQPALHRHSIQGATCSRRSLRAPARSLLLPCTVRRVYGGGP